MTNRFISPEQQFISFAGQPYAGGFLYFYISGTSTPTPTYQDQALTTPNPNPIVLDSAGNAGNIFLNSSILYKVVLADSNNNTIWTFDPVIPTDAPSGAAVNSIISCTPTGGTNAITLTPINASQIPSAYANYTVFAFVPSSTTTGAVTVQVGSLPFYPVFQTNGVQANANAFLANQGPYFIAYGSLVAGATPGFIMLNNTPSLPTVQVFTAGSGTYTTPAGVTWIEVEMVGGGGGGGGGGSSGGSAGGAGGNTTFGSLTAAGGNGGSPGGSPTIGGAASGGDINITGGSGGYGPGAGVGSTTSAGGGRGGDSAYGGGGAGAFPTSSAGPAGANTGAGGGGGGGPTGTGVGGAGGGAGGYVEKVITLPAATIAYAVGAGGGAGSAGASGGNGAAGSNGLIYVIEYYGR